MPQPKDETVSDVFVHEAAYAVVAFAVGVPLLRIEVSSQASGQRRSCRVGGVTLAIEPTLHQGVPIALGGDLAEDNGRSLIDLRQRFRFDNRSDIAAVEREVGAYFAEQATEFGGDPRFAVLFVDAYIRQQIRSLKRWLPLAAPQRAIQAVAEVLSRERLSESVIPPDDVSALCEASGVVRNPIQFRPRRHQQSASLHYWPWMKG